MLTWDALTTLSIQDDTYIVGDMVEQAKLWDDLVLALCEGGNEVTAVKSEFWWPSRDMNATAELPEPLLRLATKVRRSIGGINTHWIGVAGQVPVGHWRH